MNGKYKILEEHSLPEDFRTIDQFKEGDYLKVVFIEKIKVNEEKELEFT